MNNTFRQSACVVLLAAAIFFAGFFIALVIKHPPTVTGDMATWAGAVAGGLAFGGTIALAMLQWFQRRVELTDTASLVAAQILGEIEKAHTAASNLLSQLEFYNHDNSLYSWLEQNPKVDSVIKSSVFEAQTLLMLVPLKNRTAHRIARATGLLRSLVQEIYDFACPEVWQRAKTQWRIKLIDDWRETARTAFDLLTVALDDCRNAAEVGAPHPSSAELYGENGANED